MRDWVVSIGVVVVIISVISLLIPDGKMGKYVKRIFSLLIVLVIIKPFTEEFDIAGIFYLENNQVVYQEQYIYYSIEKRVEEYEQNSIKLMENSGIFNSKINIKYQVEDVSDIKIKQVVINLKNSVIKSNAEHIDIIEEAIKSVADYLNINKNIIKVEYE